MKHNWFMGCAEQISEKELTKYEKSGNYVAEPKRDGIFGTILNPKGKQKLISRNGLTKKMDLIPLPKGTIIVGELGYGQEEASLRKEKLGHDFADIHDAIMIKGKDISHLDDNKRHKLLLAAWKSWPKKLKEYYPLNPRWTKDFMKHYKSQPEGIVLKQIKGRPDHPYEPGKKSPFWIKCKKELTVDMVIMDYRLSTATSFAKVKAVKTLVCGVYIDGKLQPVANVGTMDTSLRIDIPKNWKKYKGKTVELKCFKVFKSGSLRHPSFSKMRPDKSPKSCTWKDLVKYM